MDKSVSKGAKSAFVAIVGRPSAGKSTLLNKLCGHKVAIISSVPQTTRNRIRGIVNDPRGQLVFIDTPGFHESDRKFNQHMRGLIEETIRDSEVVLYVLDATRPIGDEERGLLSRVHSHISTHPIVVAVNKVDVASSKQVADADSFVATELPDTKCVRISGLSGSGLNGLLAVLYTHSPVGEPAYPSEYYTDQPPEFRIAEIIREKAIQGARQELPHSIYVEVADMEVKQIGEETHPGKREQLWIRAFILVERESQKGMVVGRGGDKIKRIRTSAQKEIAGLFPYRIHLDLRVKVDPKWRRKENVLRRLVQ